MLRKRRWIGLGIAVGAAVMVACLWLGNEHSSPATRLTMSRQQPGTVDQMGSVSPIHVLPDFFQLKYPPDQRAQFHVSSSQSAAIFVVATGVQVRTDSGWQQYSEEPRNEIWRLKPGTAQDMYVEIPQRASKQIWRAYIRYGPEMHGPMLLKAQAREAWKIRSFTNWTGRAWGGGRFGGQLEFFTEEFSK